MTKNEQITLMNNIQKNSQERIKKLEEDMRILKGETAVKLFKQDSKVNEVQEKTNKLYKLYDAVDGLIAEIDENRKERAVLLCWYHDHEDRILSLEQLRSKIPAHLLN